MFALERCLKLACTSSVFARARPTRALRMRRRLSALTLYYTERTVLPAADGTCTPTPHCPRKPTPQASEGIDFADDNARAVVVLGIPYPNLKDTK